MDRKTLRGKSIPLIPEDSFIIRTQAPSKWVLVDVETGAVYTPNKSNVPYHFTKATKDQMLEAQDVLSNLSKL